MFSGELSEVPFAKNSRQAASAAEFIMVCSECGGIQAADPELLRSGSVLRAVLPQPVAAALRFVPALTPRERKAFELLGRGYDNRSISRTLKISERTAKRYVTSILSKLNLESRLQAGLTALIVSSCAATDGFWPEGRMDVPADGR